MLVSVALGKLNIQQSLLDQATLTTIIERRRQAKRNSFQGALKDVRQRMKHFRPNALVDKTRQDVVEWIQTLSQKFLTWSRISSLLKKSNMSARVEPSIWAKASSTKDSWLNEMSENILGNTLDIAWQAVLYATTSLNNQQKYRDR